MIYKPPDAKIMKSKYKMFNLQGDNILVKPDSESFNIAPEPLINQLKDESEDTDDIDFEFKTAPPD